MGKSIIVQGFPGTGKSVICDGIREMYIDVTGDTILMDFESSNFGWYTDDEGKRKRRSGWASEYVDFIQKTLEVFERENKTIVAFISSHDLVRQELIKRELEFRIVYPSVERKAEFMESYAKRGNTKAFIDNINAMFDLWIDTIDQIQYPKCKKIKMNTAMDYIGTRLGTILE